MPRPADTVDQGLRLADQGACVPWDALAAIERAQADAAERRAIRAEAGPRHEAFDRRRLPARLGRTIAGWVRTGAVRSR